MTIPDSAFADLRQCLLAYDQLGLAVVLCHPDRNVLLANQAFTELTGIDAHCVAGHDLSVLLGAAVEPAHRLAATLSRAAPAGPLWLPARHRRGEPLPLLITIHAADQGLLWLQLRRAAAPSPNPALVEPRSANTLAPSQLQLATALAGIGYFRVDLASDQVFCNDDILAMLGRLPMPLGMTMAALIDLVHPADRQELRRARERALRGEPAVDVVTRFAHADGQWRHLMTRRILERDAQGSPVHLIGVALDLTERLVHSEREVQLAQRLELATRAAGVGIWTLVAHEPRARWNEQMHQLHGLAPDQEVPEFESYIQRFMHADDRAAVREGLQTLLQRREGMVELDIRILRSDGLWRRLATRSSIEKRDGVTRILGIVLDVTEQRAAQARLRDAAERAALVARGAGIGAWEMRLSDRASWWDEQMWRLRGLEPQPTTLDSEGRMALVHPDDREVLRQEYKRSELARLPSHMEFRVRWPDGSYRWLASRSMALPDDHGLGERRIGINWDITAARATEAARQDQLLAQRESVAKSRFMARMSHELRTPLNAVLGFSQLLLAAPDALVQPAHRRQMQHVRDAGEHLLALINDVLDMASLESGDLRLDLRPIALQALMRQVVALLSAQARDAGVIVRLGDLQATPQADDTRLRQVLLNLLSNAIKYNQPGGEVEVWARGENAQVLISVRDTGRGMNAEQLQHLFEPFNRLGLDQSPIPGTGIGLAIVKTTLQHLNGTVRVESRLGQGSLFEVSLPAAAALPAAEPEVPFHASLAPPRTAPSAASGPVTPQRPGRVLYIEDNPVNVMIMEELFLRRPDLQLRCAVDGRQGLSVAAQWQPDLILLDMQLPDIDGHAVLRGLRADPSCRHMACVAVSANALPEALAAASAAGFTDYWTKPLNFDIFGQRLERWFGAAPLPAAPTQTSNA